MGIAWDDKLSVGYTPIDDDHKILIEQIALLESSDRSDRNLLTSIIQVLGDYTAEHFGREETLMARTNYGQAEQHKREHTIFIKQLSDLRRRHEQGEAPGHETLEFLKLWLTKHILKTDKMLGAHLQAAMRQSPGATAMPAQDTNIRHLKVLLVDDQLNFRALMRNVLKSLALTDVEDAKDTEEALSRLTTQSFDVVIADANVPTDAVEMTRRIRSLDSGVLNPRAVVILMPEEQPDQPWLLKVTEAGVHDVLLKPLSIDAIRTRLVRHFQNPLPMREAGGRVVVERRRKAK